VHHSAHRRQRTVQQERIFLDEQVLDNGMFVSTPTVRPRVNLKDPNVDLTEIGAVFPHPEPLGAALTGSYADDFPGISTQIQVPVQRYRARVDSLSTHASDDATVHMFGHRSDISEHSEQWMIRDFDDSEEVVRSRSSTPVRYTPTSGSDGDCVSNAEFLTLPRGPVSSDSDTPKQSLDQALQVLELDRYISVDMDKLHSRLQAKLLSCHSPAKIAKAFVAVIEHQNETDRWALCLRWDNFSDQCLLDDHCGTDHDDWSWAAGFLETTEEDCRQRWAMLKPQDWSPKSICKCASTGDAGCCCCFDMTWVPDMDNKLLSLRADRTSWVDIAKQLNVELTECKRRFEHTKPKGWTRKVKKQTKKQKAAAAKKQLAHQGAATTTSTTKVESIVVEDTDSTAWGAPAHEWPEACFWDYDDLWTAEQETRLLWMRQEDCMSWELIAATMRKSVLDCLKRFEHLTASAKDNSSGSEPPVQDNNPGWYTGGCWGVSNEEGSNGSDNASNSGWITPPPLSGGCWEASSRRQGSPEPQPATYVPPTVTYWATIESAGQKVHIPVDSRHVSGPEKNIAASGMQKVWKWVHDMRLDDKVGLQDAFDLAQSMHEEEDMEEVKVERAQIRTASRLSYRTLGTKSQLDF
jgi:hypothetical protein